MKMQDNWPKVTYAKSYRFSASHAMTHLGGQFAEPHWHTYIVKLGATHEIQPYLYGYTHSTMGLDEKFKPLIQYLDGKHLNDIMPMPPSAEAVALWLLANTQPAHCDFAEVEAYGFYTARADRQRQTTAWMDKFKLHENHA